MRKRRRRLLREDVLAPWLTLGAIAGLWWLGATVLGRATTADAPATPVTVSAPSPTVLARPPEPAASEVVLPADRAVAPTIGAAPDPAASSSGPATGASELETLRNTQPLVPVAGIDAGLLRSMFDEPRGRDRRHEALDILAPRGTPVRSAVSGKIAKLFTSAAGGLTIYQFDPTGEFCFYYAHLDGYAAGIADGVYVDRGQTIGYVGTTGNAPPGTPHLHFALFKLGSDKRWWEGVAIDPMLVLR